MQIYSDMMGKITILILMFLATAHSIDDIKIQEESTKLWSVSNHDNYKFKFTSCEDLNEDVDIELPENTNPLSPIPRLCENKETKIPDAEWERPFIKAFTELLDFYEPIPPVQTKAEETLVHDFLTRFIETQTGIELYFMLNGEWGKYGDPEEMTSSGEVRTQEEKQEDLKDDQGNKETRDKYKSLILEFFKGQSQLQQEVNADTLWDKISKKYVDIKHDMFEDILDYELNTIQNGRAVTSLFAFQQRKFIKRLKRMWFGDTEKNPGRPSGSKQYGFRHVFVGEDPDNHEIRVPNGNNVPIASVRQFKNWYPFYRQVCIKNKVNINWKTPNYLDYTLVNPNSEDGTASSPSSLSSLSSLSLSNLFSSKTTLYCIVKVYFNYVSYKEGSWSRDTNDFGIVYDDIILVGSRPDYDFAVFTLCFHRWVSKNKDAQKIVGKKCVIHADLDASHISVGGETNKKDGNSDVTTIKFRLN